MPTLSRVAPEPRPPPLEVINPPTTLVEARYQEYCYKIVMLEKLPVLDLSQTVLRKVFGLPPRIHDILSTWIDRCTPSIYATYSIACACASIGFLSKDDTVQTCFAVVSLVLSLPLLLVFLTLNAQMALLLMKCYEFWFLGVTITEMVIIMAIVVSPNQSRVLACVHVWIGLVLTLFSDATPRCVVARMRSMVVLAPFFCIDVLSIVARYVEPAEYHGSLTGTRLNLQDTDLVLNCSIIIAFFFGIRLLMNRQWLCSNNRCVLTCQSFRPSHGLVRVFLSPTQTQASRSRARMMHFLRHHRNMVLTTNSVLQPVYSIPLVDGPVNARSRLFHNSRNLFMLSKRQVLAFHCCGICGLGLTSLALGWAMVYPAMNATAQQATACIGLSCSILFCCSNLVYCQRDLTILELCEMDVWFAAFQSSLVGFCFMDMVCYDWRTLICISVLSWYHWVLCADALPPIAKDILGLSRRFMVVVIVLVMLFFVAMVVWLGFQDQTVEPATSCASLTSSTASSKASSTFGTATSPFFTTPTLFNRVVLEIGSREDRFHFKMQTFNVFTSKLVTCLLWTARLLWREVFRPRNAFRMLRSRVQYRMPSSCGQ